MTDVFGTELGSLLSATLQSICVSSVKYGADPQVLWLFNGGKAAMCITLSAVFLFIQCCMSMSNAGERTYVPHGPYVKCSFL
jgi:hypothetical protein